MLTTSLNILNEGGTIAPLNHTFIAVIPKIEKPKKVTEYRLISFCNVIYKIGAKTIANRVENVLHHIISPTQSALIPKRLIYDNIIIGYECLHKIRLSTGKKNEFVALKLDISKAYERVEWNFLNYTMQRLGLSTKWESLIMRCRSTSSFFVLINGEAKGLIHPQRELWQDCSLSPYSFIICTEVFLYLVVQVESRHLIHGLKFSRDLSISHLLFADNNLIFTTATTKDCTNLKAIFYCYAITS